MTAPTYIVAIEGLDALRFLEDIPASVKRRALQAVNKTTRDGRVMVSRAVRAQVAFTATYVGPSSGRLTAIPAKSTDKMEGLIRARTEPTSLARFTKQKPLAKGQRPRRGKGVRVTVKPGVAKYVRDAFVVRLPSGKGGPLGNLGLAVRQADPPKGAYKPKRLGENVWLLYGPSVSQVMYSERNRGGVADEIAPSLADKLENEFVRLLDLDIRDA